MRFREHQGYPNSGPAPGSLFRFQLDETNGSGSEGRIKPLKTLIDKMPELREEKVEELRDSVISGDYFVETEALAKRVVDEALKEAVLRHRP